MIYTHSNIILLTGLIQHLEKHPDLHSLFKHLKCVTTQQMPTQEELSIANGTCKSNSTCFNFELH